jgi:hypothetical protein
MTSGIGPLLQKIKERKKERSNKEQNKTIGECEWLKFSAHESLQTYVCLIEKQYGESDICIYIYI